jgi:hypothetical protein
MATTDLTNHNGAPDLAQRTQLDWASGVILARRLDW